ncbi:drebrin-like protein B isoform X2 [Channa argus]|uniref:drebrin-like protein B isoform X2 n=1 Tax=Channa argus TaxID=215402 RepID=UPI003521B132
MAVNLSKNGAALEAAYKEVVDNNSDTNWALFTYEGNSNDIRLAGKGDGGLEELVEELNSGKVMYAFCRVKDPNSGLPKYVLINWTGEGVKDSRKGRFANHVSSMANFLRGAHVTINARDDDDVEPQSILAKVAKTSGANFNFQQPSKYTDAPRRPVGSVYRKVNAVEEIQQTNKDDFWVQAQREEERRLQEENKRAELERQRVEKERKEMEERQAKEREKKTKERAQQIQQENLYQKQREEEEEKVREQQRLEQDKENMRKSINTVASVQKANEAKALIAQRSFNPRDVFRQREQSFEANNTATPAASRPGKLQSPFLSQKSFEGDESPVQHQGPVATAPTAQKSHVSSVSPVSSSAAVLHTSPVETHSPVQSPGKLQSPFHSQTSFNREESPVEPQEEAVPVLTSWRSHLSSVSHTSPVKTYSPVQPAGEDTQQAVCLASACPRALRDELLRSLSDADQTEEQEWSEVSDNGDEAAPDEYSAQDYLYDTPKASRTQEELYQNLVTEGDHGENANGQNIIARALYDYQAVDDTEITFDPGDLITGIEMVDEGWWRGFAPDESYGLFPANYVELL